MLDAARLAGPQELAAALDCTECFTANRPASRLPRRKCPTAEYIRLHRVSWYKLNKRSTAWAAGVLARHGAVSAGACGMLQGAAARAPAREPGLARTDAPAIKASPELIDMVVSLVLRSKFAR